MAMSSTGGKRNSSPAGRGSCDSDNDFPCNPCMSDGKQTESVVYCLECNEHLCAACRRIHRRIKVSREHFLIYLGSDPSETKTEVCEEHCGKMVAYFCECHQQLCCSACLNIDHKTCDNITDIAKESTGIKDSKELQECLTELDRLRSKYQGLSVFKERQNREIKKQTIGSTLIIKRLRTGLNSLFDHLEKEALGDTNDVCNAKMNANTTDADLYRDETSKLRSVFDRLYAVQDIAGEAQLYITMQRSRQQVQRYTDILQDAENDQTEVTVTFRENEYLVKMLGELKTLGQPVTDYIYLSKSPTPKSPISAMRKRAVPVGGHSVRTKDDKTTCNITSIAILPDGRIVLADYGNKQLKLFNPNFIPISQLIISSRPLSIVVLDRNEMMISSADENSLLVCHINGTMIQTRQIKTTEKYVSLTTTSAIGDIYASCFHDSDEGRIHMLDKAGKMKGSLGQNNDSLTLIRPTSILLNDSGNLLFINDIGRNCVICVDVSRFPQYSIVFQYTDRDLQLHDGIAIGEDGYVYVSSRNGSVQQISCFGDKVHEIINRRNGINAPACLAHCAVKNTLYVAEQKHNSIKMFSIL